MGRASDATCEGCGYTEHVVVGGTRETFHKHSVWPVFCRECNALEHANTRISPLRCLKCGSDAVTKYGDPSVSEVPDDKAAFRWGDAGYLRNGRHYCPRCKKMTLKFGSSGRGILFD